MPESNQSRRTSRRPPGGRQDFRAASDAAAHADSALNQPIELIDHPLVPRGAPATITDTAALESLIAALRQAGSFAFDSEFIGELSYVPQLCLIQVASAHVIALIDPFSGIDLTGFWELIRDPGVLKIVHAGQQDVEPVFRDGGLPAARIFDTQIAAGFVGLGYPLSLGKLIHAMVGVKLHKGLTFTHWDRRPLSQIQIRYAADDVRYLPALHQALSRRLVDAGHDSWAEEESSHLCDPANFRFDADIQLHRTRGSGGLSASGAAVLRELLSWRDSAARLADVPPRTFVRDEVLIDLSRHPPRTPGDLSRVRGLPRPVEEQNAQEIVQAARTGLASPRAGQSSPDVAEPIPVEKFRADSLWAVAQCLCTGQQLDPNLVASRQEVLDFYFSQTSGADAAGAPHPLLTGWRRHALGEPLLEFMQGRGKIHLQWKTGSLHAHRDRGD